MAEAPKTGMPMAEMKKLLNGVKEDVPLRVAVGKLGEVGLMILSKLKAPKALETEMKAEFKDVKDVRFGTAQIDVENGSQVNLSLNKPASGMAKRLVKTLKGSGYNKVVILAKDEDGNDVVDGAGDEDDAAKAAPAVEAAAPPPPPPPPPAPPAAAVDAASLTKRLAGLIPRVKFMAGAEPARGGPLLKLTGEAGAALKGGKLDDAARLMKEIEDGLAGPATASGEAPAGGAQVNFAKTRLAWIGARKKIESETQKLRLAIIETYKEEGIADELDKRFTTKVQPFLDRYDMSLADMLDEAGNATDDATRAERVAAAKKLIGEYRGKLDSDPDIADLDNNPFSPLAIHQTVSATLSALDKALV